MDTWKIAKMEPCSLPEPVATGFKEAFAGWIGATYTPVLYCGEQLVHGTNYLLICYQTLLAPPSGPNEHVVKVLLNKPLPSDADPSWHIISVEPII